MNLSTLSEQHKTVIYVFFFYFFQYFIYLPFIPVWAFHSFEKWDQNEIIRIEFYYFSQNVKPGRIRDVNFQRYAVNSKCQEYWQRIHKNLYSFYTKFVNFFPYNVLYKKVQVFESKNHENWHFMKKKKIKILKFWGYNIFWTFANMLKFFFCCFLVILNILKQVSGDLKFWSSRLT